MMREIDEAEPSPIRRYTTRGVIVKAMGWRAGLVPIVQCDRHVNRAHFVSSIHNVAHQTECASVNMGRSIC
jgi:glycogen synthase